MQTNDPHLQKQSLREPILIIYILLLIGVILITAAGIRLAFFTTGNPLNEKAFAVTLGILLLFSRQIYLSATYFIEEINQKVALNKEKREIVVERNGEVLVIGLKDIVDCYHVRVNPNSTSRLRCNGYEYVLIMLKERKRIYITNLRCETKEIISLLRITPKEVNSAFPRLNRHMGDVNLTTNEFEDKVVEFYERFKEKSNEELLTICSQPNVYTPYAIKAARKLLSERRNRGN